LEVLYDEDDTVDVGEVIARVGDADAAPAAKEEAEEASAAVEKDEEPVKANEETEEDSTDVDAGDATDVEMPELGESVTEGTITTWLKKVGDTVEVD
ncbi:biotin/lipoyl-containing protein, partial [Corynebacterium sp. 401_CJEI]